MTMLRLLLVASAVATCTHAFVVRPSSSSKPSLVTRQALWRHFVPRDDAGGVWHDSQQLLANAKNGVLASCLALVIALPAASLAVSGGGLDFANLDITGQDFSNGSYKGKDFTQVCACDVWSCGDR